MCVVRVWGIVRKKYLYLWSFTKVFWLCGVISGVETELFYYIPQQYIFNYKRVPSIC